ncbi:hypothetical protein FRB95_005015 [Tulasnella sp. JGI-2019a]|nr:hypothetical protein FRB95_005015 [Tulasnella sp. JGI-2019a]
MAVASTSILVRLGDHTDERGLRLVPSSYLPPNSRPSRRHSVLRSIRMSMAISTNSSPPPIPPMPPNSTSSPTPYRHAAQNTISEPSLRLQTRYNNSSNVTLNSSNRPTGLAPSSYHGSQESNTSFSSNEGGSGSTGQRLKALANRRFRKNGSKGSSGLLGSEDSEETGSDMSPGPTPTQSDYPQQTLRPPPSGRERAQSDAEGLAQGRGQRSNPRSKLQAFTSNLLKHHALMSQPGPGLSPLDTTRPVPPPKPDALRAPPSPTYRSDSDTAPISPSDGPSSLHPSSAVARSSPVSGSAHGSVVLPQAVPKNVIAAAGKVIGDKRNSPPTLGVLRNSFQMANTPSISAALHYMHGTGPEANQGREPQQNELKKEKRRSGGILRPVPEHSAAVPLTASSSQSSVDQSSGSAVRAAVPRPGLTTTPSKNRNRRSASLGDIFKGSAAWAPAIALAGTASSSKKEPKPMNAAQAMKNRPPNPHRRSGSNGSGSSLEGLARTTSNSSPLNPASNVAATYQYVNAELRDDSGPSSFIVLRPPGGSKPSTPAPQAGSQVPQSDYAFPPPRSSSNTSVSTAASNAPIQPAAPAKHVGGIILPPMVSRKKSIPTDNPVNVSGAEFGLKVKPAPIGAPPPLPQRNNIAPGAYSAPSTGESQGLRTFLSSGPGGNSSRSRANSSNTSSNNYPSQRVASSGVNALSRPTNAVAAAANTAGAFGAAAGVAGGMAMNFGRRVGNLWGHRSGQSIGNWSGLSGGSVSGTEDGHGGWGSSEGSPSDVGYASTAPKGGTRMLGPLLRPPTRQGRGAVFGRSLQECVAETRIGVRATGRVVDDRGRGEGLWVTALVTRCVAHLTRWGLDEEGLFRITGRQTHVNKIRGEFDTGADYDLQEAHPSDLDPHAVSSIFKAYLRELPEPILTKRLMPLFDLALSLGMRGQGEDPLIGVTSFGGGVAFDGNQLPTEEAMVELKGLMDQLPAENYDLLHELAKFLRLTAEKANVTKMPLSNLLLVFCPSLHLNPAFLKLIIQRQDYFFGDGEMGKVAAPAARVDKVDGTCETTSQATSLKGPTLPSRPTRSRDINNSDEARRNRTTSVMIPGFSVTFQAYTETAAELASAPIPIRGRTATLGSSLLPSSGPGTPVSSIGSTPSRSRVQPPSQPSPVPSLKSRVARRQPSLASLFSSSNKTTIPSISSPIPYVPATPKEPPILDVELPDGSFSVGSEVEGLKEEQELFLPLKEDQTEEYRPSLPRDGDSPTSSSSSSSDNVDQAIPSLDSVPRPIAQPIAAEYSPPPRIAMFETALKRSTGDGWAAGVLMAAAGDS